jgi:hypothetical protein
VGVDGRSTLVTKSKEHLVLQHLSLARLRFQLIAQHDCDVPPYKGDMLRMALLWWLQTFWCAMPDRCRHGCRQPGVCMFGRLNSPSVDPAWPAKVRYLFGNSPPPAYALWDLQDRRPHFARGARWAFELTLVGALALDQIPAIVAAVQQGAEQGMGRVRLRSRVCRVTAVLAGQRELLLADEQPRAAERTLTWRDYRIDQVSQSYADGLAWAERESAPIHGLCLHHLSPVQVRERERTSKRKRLVQRPTFGPWARALVRRLRILTVVYGAGEWPHAEFGPLLDLAETVQLAHDETLWSGYTRFSASSGEREIEGFGGQAWYTSHADLRPLLPILWLGQWLHVGSGYVMGNGRYVVQALYS